MSYLTMKTPQNDYRSLPRTIAIPVAEALRRLEHQVLRDDEHRLVIETQGVRLAIVARDLNSQVAQGFRDKETVGMWLYRAKQVQLDPQVFMKEFAAGKLMKLTCVVLHEIGHAVSGHIGVSSPEEHLQHEMEADAFVFEHLSSEEEDLYSTIHHNRMVNLRTHLSSN